MPVPDRSLPTRSAPPLRAASARGVGFAALLVALVVGACGGEASLRPERLDPIPAPPLAAPVSDTVRYAFSDPAARFELPGDLDEISGITFTEEGVLAAVQDEEGLVFRIEAETGDVLSEHDFGGDGDYEDLALARGTLYILRSDGRLYRVTESDGDTWHTDDVDLDLPDDCDAEGLAYDAPSDRLLVACKEASGAGRRVRGVYAYDLDDEETSSAPVYTIALDALRDVPALDGRRLHYVRNVRPSALARHPGTGDLYVLSAVEKAVVVLGPGGTLRGTYTLPDDLFRQPESLVFAPDGTLYVASEAAGKAPVLMRFTPLR